MYTFLSPVLRTSAVMVFLAATLGHAAWTETQPVLSTAQSDSVNNTSTRMTEGAADVAVATLDDRSVVRYIPGVGWSAPIALGRDYLDLQGICGNTSGTLVISMVQTSSNPGSRSSWFSRSSDNGQTWSLPAAAAVAANYYVYVNQTVCYAGDNTWVMGWLQYYSGSPGSQFDSDVYFARSTDDGISWSPVNLLNSDANSDGVNDEDLFLGGSSSGTVIAVWRRRPTTGGDRDIFFARSVNRGVSWSAPVRLNLDGNIDTTDDIHPRVATDGSGNWHAVWDSGGTVKTARSNDDGATWNMPNILGSGTDPEIAWNGGSSFGVVFSQTAGDTEIRFVGTANGGQTWTNPQYVNPNSASDTGNDSTPLIAGLSDLGWLISWDSSNINGSGSDTDPFYVLGTPDVYTSWDLQVLKSSPTTPYRLAPMRYVVTAINHGPINATNVRVEDRLPSQVTLMNAFASPGGETSYGNNVYANFGTMAPGTTATLTIDALVVQTGQLNNTASGIADESNYESTLSNNQATHSASVRQQTVDLELLGFDFPDPARIGEVVEYHLQVYNHGPSMSSNAVLRCGIPADADFDGAITPQGTINQAGGVVTANLGAIAIDEMVEVIVRVIPRRNGVMSTTADVVAENDPVPLNNNTVISTLVESVPTNDLQISGSASKSSAQVGEEVVFTLHATNAGPDPEQSVMLQGDIPPGLEFVSASATTGTVTVTPNSVQLLVDQLPPGGEAGLTITARATAAGNSVQVAVVAGSSQDPDLTNNFVALAVSITALPAPDLTGNWTRASETVRQSRRGSSRTLNASVELRNIGPQSAGRYTAMLYLADAPAGSPRQFLKKVSGFQLRAGQSQRYSVSVRLPAGQSSAGQYLIAVIDPDNAIREQLEGNNEVVTQVP